MNFNTIANSLVKVARMSALVAVMAALSPAPQAEAASSGPYSMEVLVNGTQGREYYSRGITYVEARRGREYAVRLSNHTGERVAVALAVDGLNSIDAKHTSAVDARKWILGPYESIVIEGWQTSSDTSRKFYFTNEANSYGAWMGDTRNLGNISAAFFREQRPVPRPYVAPQPYPYEYDEEARYERAPSADRAAPSAGTGAMEGGAEMAQKSAPSSSARGKSSAMREMAPKDDLAATGIGREQRHEVYSVEFRQQRSPAAVVTVRYEYRNKLIELGILPRPVRPDPTYRRETSSGFSDYGYAPDPYRGR